MIRLNHNMRLPQKLPTAPLPIIRTQSLPSETPSNTPIDTPDDIPPPTPTRTKSQPKPRGRPKKTSPTVSNTSNDEVDKYDHQQDLKQL